MAFAEDANRLSPGVLALAESISWLADEGVSTFDLGQDLAYKAAWADSVDETITLVVAG